MKVIYAQEDLSMINTFKDNVIFLAGPTPRKENVKSWRPKAIKLLKANGFDGYVLVPEMKNGFQTDFAYNAQIGWEQRGLDLAQTIIFWVPRDLKDMPAFTTNIEWGQRTTMDPSGCILGYPKKTPKMDYMRYQAIKENIPILRSLKKTVITAIQHSDGKLQ